MSPDSRKLGETPRAVFAATLRHGTVTRRQLAEDLGVSFPTITAALAELGGEGLVEEAGSIQGPRGRAKLLYRVAPTAGWVLGLDIGSTQVTGVAQRLDGAEPDRFEVSVPRDIEKAGDAAALLVNKLLDSTPYPLRAITVAVNQIVPQPLRSPHHQGSERARAARIVDLALSDARISDEVPVAVENNVNCAAVAEHEDGALQGLMNGAYMQAGVGIGLGFFSEGVLVRGASGASGELAQIPVSWDAGIDSPRDAIEQRFGSAGLLARAAELMGSEPLALAEEIFGRAEQGDECARKLMAAHAVALGRIASAAATLLDPAVLVIGGGLARNELFTDLLAAEFSSRLPHVDIQPSRKGTGATIQGASLIARDVALTAMLGPLHRPLVPRPTLWARPGLSEGDPLGKVGISSPPRAE